MLPFIVVITVYATCSLLLLVYGLQCYILSGLFLRKRSVNLKRQRERMQYFNGVTDSSLYPKVLTQIPLYNEKSVAQRVIDAAVKMDYPGSRHEIQVLDDSNDDTVEVVDGLVADYRAQGVNIKAVRREDRVGFKAGALQNGLRQSDAEFVAIFDSDFSPNSDFLKKAVPFFIDSPEIGLVQGRWDHINRSSSMLTRGQAVGIDGHFMIEQAARSWNSLFMNFNGTAGMFRISAIEDAGGWQHDTLTEDMDLSYRLQLAGWKAEFLPELPVPAEIPEDVNAFKSQQFRWAKGSIQTAIKIGPRLFKRKDVSIFKKIQAMLHLTHYCVHPLMLAMIILTLPMLTFVHIHLPLPFFVVFIFAIILASSGPSFMYMVSQHFLGQKKRRLILKIPVLMVIGTGLVINNTKAVLEAVMNKTSPFIRTPKKGAQKGFVYASIKDFMFLLELLVGVYCAFTAYLYLGYDNAFISPFLVLYMSGCLFMGMLSVFHTFLPVLIDFKLPFAKERD